MLPEDMKENYNLLLRDFLRFAKLTKPKKQQFLFDFLSLIASRDEILPTSLFFDPKLSEANLNASTGPSKNAKFQEISVNPALIKRCFLGKSEDLIRLLITFEHEVSHNFTSKNWPENFQKFDKDKCRKNMWQTQNLLNFFCTFFANSEFQEIANKTRTMIYLTSHFETVARLRAMGNVQKFLKDAQNFAQNHQIYFDFAPCFKVIEKQLKNEKVYQKNMRLLMTDKVEFGGKCFSELMEQLDLIVDAFIAKDFSALPYIPETICDDIMYYDGALFDICDLKPLFRQERLDKLFDFYISANRLNVLPCLKIINLYNNQNTARQLRVFFDECALRENDLNFLEEEFKKIFKKHKYIRRVPYKCYHAEFCRIKNQKSEENIK